ncbi:uncharacterized protein [Dysidea avara]|uniref:uncharacterized protein n=1 Tax=Dysidea avara TaxID=196820 RepID=UPI003326D4D4
MSQPKKANKKRKYPNRIGHWLPKDQKNIKKWLDDLIKEVEQKYSKEKKTVVKLDKNFVLPKDWLDPLIQEFWDLVDKDPTLHMQYNQMFTEVTESQTPTETPQIQSYQVMFLLVNFIMKNWAPRYNDYGLVGFPINVILNWSMGTVNGYAAFLNKEANDYWMKVLNKWGEFLKSPQSCYVLVDKPWGWFGENAQLAMPNFKEEFQCDPSAPHYGYTSWDDFFIRKFKDGVRPVACPDDMNVICSACESLPYDLQYDVQYKDEFWIKEQWYSLRHMLNEDEYTSQFVGGTIYQAFLSALNYHRWHSPIDGKVIKAYNIPGTYYSATLSVGKDEASPDKSQGYICQVAARSVMFIEADNPAIGLMCFVAIGMSEVSTCEINSDLIPVDGPKRVKKGQEIGMFHFGGSTHCLLFRPGVNLEFDQTVLDAFTDPEPENIKLNAKLATVVTKGKGK